MSDLGVISAKCRILEIFSELEDVELESIERWICSQSYKKGQIYDITLLK